MLHKTIHNQDAIDGCSSRANGNNITRKQKETECEMLNELSSNTSSSFSKESMHKNLAKKEKKHLYQSNKEKFRQEYSCEETESSDKETENATKLKSRKYGENVQNTNSSPLLPSISNFFNLEVTKTLDDSSEDECMEVDDTTKKRKKKLNAAEKIKQAKLKEEYIHKIEKEQLNAVKNPENADQFERILLAEPNSSALWIKYLAFYLALAEFDKARAVGKRALETINVALEDEKLNVWISLLNLEIYYGTKESFEKLFKEAVNYNDAYQIYAKVIDMLHEAGKVVELEEKIKTALLKFKQEPEIWLHIAKIYYLLGNFEKARNTRNICLKSINSKKQQYSLIIKFAILEFNHGDIDVGSSIFELVLEDYPNKVGAWLVYIDQLISKHLIDQARYLFNRIISLKFPLRAMKVIYHKYRAFEEKHGTPQSRELFKETAKKILQQNDLISFKTT